MQENAGLKNEELAGDNSLPKPEKKIMSPKIKTRIALTVAVILSAVVFFTALGFLDKRQISAQSKADFEIQSILEMTEVSLMAQSSGEIKEIYVNEGDTVSKGQALLILDDRALIIKRAQAEAGIKTIQGQIHAAQANLTAADAKLQQKKEGAKPEEIVQAKSNYDLAEANCTRMAALYQADALSQADYDAAVANRDIKKAQYEMLLAGATNNEIKEVQANVASVAASLESLEGQLQSAQSSLAEIELQLEKTKIVAVNDGILSQFNAKLGELISAGSRVASIVDDRKPWIQCSVKETDIARVVVGQTVNIRFGAYQDQSYSGKVVSINKSADFAAKRATNENGSFDIRAFGVKVELDPVDIPLYAGMTVFVSFNQ